MVYNNGMDTSYTVIRVLRATRNRLTVYAAKHNRTPHKQIVEWLDAAERAENIEYLPFPEGAQPVPLIRVPAPDKICQCTSPLPIYAFDLHVCLSCGGRVGSAPLKEVKDGNSL